MTDHSSPPPTVVASGSLGVYETLRSTPFAVLCGRNNSGKTFLLRKLVQEIGENAAYLGPARYQNFILLSAIGPRNRKQQKWDRLLQQLRQSGQNIDASPLNLAEAIAELSDSERKLLFELLDRLLDTHTDVRYTIPDNSMSQMYVSVDGYNLSYTSSGFRLVAILLTSLLDTDSTTYLIDEPELGLSPEIQGIVSDFLLDEKIRKEHFPHVESILLATHSPIFLDRKTIGNNYFVDREGPEITIRRLATIQDLNSLQFYLLGNRFETLFLPSAIVLVEGSCDFDYLNRLMSLRYPDSMISVIRCDGDGRIREVVNVARQMLTDIRRSPYADRIFIVLDSVHGTGLVEQVEKMGVTKENIVVWEANGVEFVYPRAILERRFGNFDHLEIQGDEVSANGVVVRKKELADFVVEHLSKDDVLPDEIHDKLLNRLKSVLY